VQRNAVPNTVVAPSTQGMVYPHQARSCVHGGTAALAPVSTVYQQAAAIQSPAKQVQQSPGRLGVLQPRNVVNVQVRLSLWSYLNIRAKQFALIKLLSSFNFGNFLIKTETFCGIALDLITSAPAVNVA